MNFKKIILGTSLALICFCMSGQTSNKTTSKEDNFPTESVYVHYNSTLLFSGETLYYKFYSLNNFSNELSNISKVGYVELIGEGKQAVFKHKISLTNGQGFGDFLLPSDISSGNYKLVGYTLWMNNNDKNKFFQADLKIINPYKAVDQSTVVSDSLLHSLKSNSSTTSAKSHELILQKKTYKTRDQVQFSITTNKTMHSDISISIHKANSIGAMPLTSSEKFNNEQLSNVVNKTISQNNVVMFPEIRGAILNGLLKSDSLAVSNKRIALSIPSGGLLNIVKTDNNGRFDLNVNEHYNNNKLYAQVFENNADNYKLEIEPSFKMDYSKLNFEEFKIRESDVEKILKRSILNQIDNAYLFTKTDSIIVQESNLPFDKSYDLEYDLDDYNRFSDMKEVFVEIINQAQIYQTSNNNYQFAVLNQNGSYDKSIPPLLVFDGIIIKDPNPLIYYNAKSVKTIKIIKNKYFLGSDIFNGVIVFQTINNDFSTKVVNSAVNKFELYDLEDTKQYKNMSYLGNSLTENNRIPDYRKQLYWNPSVKLNGDKNDFTFYTSDNSGEFEIRIEGFTEQGEPVSLSSTFTVIEE